MGNDGFDNISQFAPQRILSRRQALKVGSTGLVAAAGAKSGPLAGRAAAQTAIPAAGSAATPTGEALPITGQSVAELEGFDTAITALMPKWHLPGGQLAVAKDGRLVLNRGYGFADAEQGEPVQPTSLFRIASVSKAITAVAILTLVDAGKLTLDTKAFPLLGLRAADHATPDPRLYEITVEQLLVHAGGWDSATSFDPQYLPWSRMAAATVGLDDPAEASTIIRYMLGTSLDFDPGTKSVYSNFGFTVLGRIIEHVSGQPYAMYVRDHVLTPAGISVMQIGRTRLEHRAPGEVLYYSPPGLGVSESVFWGEGYVPVAYGSYYLEALDAHGGWIASAADLVRFGTAVDGQRGAALLTPSTLKAMITTPRPKEAGHGSGWDSKPVTAGLGWDLKPVANGVEWAKPGALAGTTASWLFRGTDGLTIAFSFNSLPDDFRAFVTEAGQAILTAAHAVQTLPTHDLF
ncbi:MAG: serine hydrolase domain-containing protein [Thermomicrobiales bacterium]